MKQQNAVSRAERLLNLSEEARESSYRYGRLEQVRLWLERQPSTMKAKDDGTMTRTYWHWLFWLTVLPVIAIPVGRILFHGWHYSVFLWGCVAVTWLALGLGLATCQEWRAHDLETTLCRFVPLGMMFILVGNNYSLIEGFAHFMGVPISAFQSFDIVATFVILLPFLLIWLNQFKIYGQFQDESPLGVAEQKLFNAAWSWAEVEAAEGERTRAERRDDWAFALLAAVVFNAFTLVGNLENPPAYLAITTGLVILLTVNWARTLQVWRKKMRANVIGVWGELVWVILVVVGLAIFGVQGGLAAGVSETPLVEKFNADLERGESLLDGMDWKLTYSDSFLFLFQSILVSVTACLPIFASLLYRRSIELRLGKSGFSYWKNGQEFLRVDQQACSLTPLPVPAPPRRFSVTLKMLDNLASESVLTVHWKRGRVKGAPTLVFNYAVLYSGRYSYIFGIESDLRLGWKGLYEQNVRDGDAATSDCPYRLSTRPLGVEERDSVNETQWSLGDLQIVDYRVPPLVPGD